MRILILDDDPLRLAQFRRKFIGNVVKCTTTAKECIEALDAEDWDEVYLDHDLGGEIYVESGPGTGYEVACWLEQHPERQPSKIYLHSLNTGGRWRMAQALPNAVQMPFAWYNEEELNLFGE